MLLSVYEDVYRYLLRVMTESFSGTIPQGKPPKLFLYLHGRKGAAMIRFLAKLFIKDYQNTEEEKVRISYGILCGMVGICLNVLLFVGKYAAGVLSSSVAVTADAFNNLSDAGSSLITLIGFRIAGKKADKDHPFGHGRMEYISGLGVCVLIFLMGVEVLRDSVEKIISLQEIRCSMLVVWILLASIAVKMYMAFYNHSLGKKLDSASLQATAADSISDVAATSVVLLSIAVKWIFDISIDGWCGLVVGVFILYAGISAAKDTLNPLLGEAPSEELVGEIKEIVLAHPQILGLHDLIVHDYGPGRRLISLHGEVSGEDNIYELHDVIDGIEQELREKLRCDAVIHMDPVAIHDPVTQKLREQFADAVKVIDPQMTIHDLRLMREGGEECLAFDAVLPQSSPLSDQEALGRLEQLVNVLCKEGYQTRIRIDHA